MSGRILDQRDIIANVSHILEEVDGYTLEQIFNRISRTQSTRKVSISYIGDDIFEMSA